MKKILFAAVVSIVAPASTAFAEHEQVEHDVEHEHAERAPTTEHEHHGTYKQTEHSPAEKAIVCRVEWRVEWRERVLVEPRGSTSPRD